MRLTSAQKQLYDMEVFAGESIGVICGTVLFDKIYDIDEMKHAISEVYKINESLRTRIKVENGEPIQYITEYVERDIKVLRFNTEDEVHEFANKMAHTPFDFSGNLCELDILMSEKFCGVIYRLHHIISDGWTLALIASHFYKILNGEPVEACPYSSYIDEETKYLQSKRAKKDKEYFTEQYHKIDEPVYFCDAVPTIGKSIRKSYIIDKAKTSQIMEYVEKGNTSAYTFFLTLISTYISKIKNNAEKFFVGTTVLNRTTHSQRNTAGMFVNTVPFLAEMDNESDFATNIKKFEENVFSLFRHQKYNYVDLLSDIGEDRLFDIIFSYQNNTIYGDHTLSTWYHNGMQNESLQIHIDDRDSDNIFRIHYDYQTEKFTENDINTLHQRLIALICDTIESPDKPLYKLNCLTDKEKNSVVYSFNNTTVEYSKEHGIYELFENHVTNTPNKLAIIFKDEKLTYSQLNEKVIECADRLASIGLKANDVIAVHLERSHELIVFQLAILKMGAIFLPVDKRYPLERIQQMCINCDVRILITDELDESVVNANVINLNDLKLITPTNSAVTAINLGDCYIIYTSGSTGTPKGCLLTGKGLLNFCLNNNTLETLNNIENPIFACVNSASFDYFIAETLLPLTNGFTMVMLSDEESTMQEQFLDVVAKTNINVIMTTPTRLKIYFNDKHNCSALKNMACLCTSGEPLTPELLEQMYAKSPNAMVYNPIGPSECSVWDMGGRLEKADGLDIHIGKPIANAQIYIVDKYLNPTPIGVTGEICIAGDGVGSGYINNPELTAERFISNPFGEGKLYKTGDLAYWREDGNICYVGRNDFQVKVRGLRIELGEIESVLETIDGVERAVAVVREDNQNRQLICAFYTGKESDAKEFRTILNTKLPRYMVPHIFTHLKDMPMTSSGKLDRKALPEIDLTNISADIEFVAPVTEEEIALAKTLATVLNVEEVSMLDNFFNIGGDSITAIYVVSELEDMGYELHVADIMQSGTLSAVTKAMKSTSDKAIYDQNEVNGFIPFSPIMRAYLKENDKISNDFVHTCIVSADCDKYIARKALDTLISHHDILRGAFVDNGIEIHSSNEREVYSFNTIAIDDEVEAIEYLKNTSLEEDKLMNVVFCNTEKENLLSITVHHFLIDLVSWEVLMKDFQTVVEQLNNNEEISLSSKTASFKLWSEELLKYSETMSEENKEYWENANKALDNAKSLSCCEENDAEKFTFTFPKNISDKLLNEVNNIYGTRTNEVLLTALGLAAGKIADGSVGIIVESHGRTELHKPIVVERTIGWFTSCYPVVINNNTDVTNELVNVKETMRRIPKNGIDYLLLTNGFHKNTDIIFNFYKTNENRDSNLVSFNSDTSVFPGKICVDCSVIDNILTVNISVPKCNHKLNICKELGIEFKKRIENLVDLCTTTDTVVKTRSDFSDDKLSEIELKEIKEIYGNSIEDVYALTPSQEGIYAQYFQSTDTKTYQLQNLCRISKEADLEMLKKSVDLLSIRHQALKTAFTVLKSGAIKQVILENRNPEVAVFSYNEPFSQDMLDKLVNEDTERTLDLQKDSLFRVAIIDFTDERYMLMHTHHIILDGWCFPIIITDLQNYYAKLLNGTDIRELTAEINNQVSSQTSYAQYANWIKNQDTHEISAYWQNLLLDCSPAHIYGKEKKDNTKNEDIISFTTPLNNELSQHIEQFAKERKVSPNTVFECAFGVALQKYSGSEDIVFDKIISGRSISLKNIENTVGLFINTIPVRIKSNESSTLSGLLKETQKQTISANMHGILSLAEVYKTCNIDAKSIDSLFVFENYFTGDISDIENGPLSPKLISFDEQTEFNLTVTLLKENNGYAIRTSYAKEVYAEKEIESFVEGYISILTSSLDETKQIKDISVLSEDEKNIILNDFNNTPYAYNIPEGSTLYSLFHEQATKNANKVCIKANDKEITFKDFKAYTERIDGKVREITKEEKSVIAVICERSFEMYGSIYGIIRGGNAYLPIDPNYPQDRIDYILENSNAKAVITQDKFCHLAGNTPCIDATEVLNNEETVKETEILANENDTAYVIYTSGSTGNPKGAKISHKSAVNRILWMHDFYPLEENDVILQKTPYTFDVSVWEHFWWGITGRTLCASKPDEHFLPAKILEEVERNKVTHLHFVPSVFDLFLTYLENNKDEQSKFNSVKYVFLSGEALTANHIKRFYNIYDYNKVTLHNLYGPTECAVDVSYYPCVPTDVDPVPIGKPIYNTQLHIVDKYLNPTPIGVVGELCIAGVNVGQGYLNNEQLTNEKFIDNPFGEGKLYKTGDLAYWREDGNICYVGRMDSQIKLNGQRIELGEIEKVIGEVSGVESVAVIIKQNNDQDVLVAFCCGNESSINEILKYCESKLPQYMIPSKFVFIEKMPLNPSGKLDRKALKNTDVIFDNEVVKEEPITDTEKLICKLFQKTLHIDFVGRNESFFTLGGTSLDMISILSENELKNISAADFIAYSTAEKLAKLLDDGIVPDSDGFYTLRNVPYSTKALILFPYAGGDASAFASLTKDLETLAPDLSIFYVDYLHSYKECETVAEKISELSKSKEINIYSHCAGTAVALQIINILEEKGVDISNYMAGGFIPLEKPRKHNMWNLTPKKIIQRILIKAGAPIDNLSAENKLNMIENFCKDTDFMTEYFHKSATPINAKTSIVISKTDMFTKNYNDAERLWKVISKNFDVIHYIDATSHYFQTDESEKLAQIVINTIIK